MQAASTLQNTPSRYRVIFAGISALILTVGLARFAYTPMLPIMCDQAGLSHLAAGWLATINYAGYVSGAVLAASTSDLQRKFILYRIGLVVAVLSITAMGLTSNFWVWAVLRFVAGYSSIAGLLLASGLVLNWLLGHRHRPELGLHFTGMGLGIALSGIAVGVMINWLNWAHQWFGLGALGLLFFFPAWFWLPAPPVTSPAAQHATSTSASPNGRWLVLFNAAYFCAGFGFVTSATFIVAIVEKLPMLAGRGSWVWVIVGLSAMPSSFLWDRVAMAAGQMRALMLAFALQTIGIMIPVVTDGAALNILGAVLFGGTFVGIVSLTLTLIGLHYPANPAKAMARMALSYGAAQIVAPAMAGHIATVTGSYHGALIVTALVMLAGIVLLQGLVVEERRAVRP